MDKYEYRIRAEEINNLIEKKEYAEAVKIADSIDWRRVRSVVMLCKISELYKINRRYEDSMDVLLLAYELKKSRKIVYSLCELSIKLEETVQALEYYKEFVKIAPKDTGRFILRYRLYELQDVSLEERIDVLEEYKKRDYREKWAYELAYLYHRIGLATRCVEECDELELWFGEGKYVIKALELKMLHAPLTPEQQEKYNARFLVPVVEEAVEKEEPESVEPALSIEIKSVEATKAKTAEIPRKKINEEIEDVEEEPVSEEPVYETEIPEEEPEMPSEEDEDMKIVNPNEDLDIQVKTIDVGDAYNTINLQDELAKNLAEMFAQEDMEAADATRALPIESIFEATGENFGELSLHSQEQEEPEIEEFADTKEIPEVEEIAEVEEEPETEEIAEIEEVPEIEEIIEAEEEPEIEEIAEIEEEPEMEEIAEIEEESEIEEIAEVKEVPEIEEIAEVEEVPEIEEIAEIEEIPEIEPIVFGQNQPLPDSLIQAVQSAAMEAVKEAAKQAAVEAAAEAAAEAARQTAEVMKEMKPEIAASSVQEEEPAEAEEEAEAMVEKQITGQLSFNDIMAEWEETKKANEEKHLQEMKQRVMEQTGPMFSDFDAATKASVQSDLDMLSPMLDVFSVDEDIETEKEAAIAEDIVEDVVAQEPEMEEVADDVYAETEDLVAEIEDALGEEPTSAFNTEEIIGLEEKLMDALDEQHYDTSNLQAAVLEKELADSLEEAVTEEVVTEEPAIEEIAEAEEEPVTEKPVIDESEKQPVNDAVKEAAMSAAKAVAIAREAAARAAAKEAAKNPEREAAKEEAKVIVSDEPRLLTKEEKEVFGGIAPTKELQENIAHVLDGLSLLPYTGNVIISGEKGTGVMETAKSILEYFAKKNKAFTGKYKVYSSEKFTGKDIYNIINDLSNQALIIENAGEMSADLCNKLIKAGNAMENGGILYILLDTKSGIERLIRTHERIKESFDLYIDIAALDNDRLVNFGKEYAREKEYSIDDMGVLALYNRIEERQTSEHAVTVHEVKEIIDMAIEKSDKKNFSHFVDVLFAKRYDKEDMIVLREKDFISE